MIGMTNAQQNAGSFPFLNSKSSQEISKGTVAYLYATATADSTATTTGSAFTWSYYKLSGISGTAVPFTLSAKQPMLVYDSTLVGSIGYTDTVTASYMVYNMNAGTTTSGTFYASPTRAISNLDTKFDESIGQAILDLPATEDTGSVTYKVYAYYFYCADSNTSWYDQWTQLGTVTLNYGPSGWTYSRSFTTTSVNGSYLYGKKNQSNTPYTYLFVTQ